MAFGKPRDWISAKPAVLLRLRMETGDVMTKLQQCTRLFPSDRPIPKTEAECYGADSIRGGVALDESMQIEELKRRIEALERENRTLRETVGRCAPGADDDLRALAAVMEYVPEAVTLVDAPEARVRMVSRYSGRIVGLSSGDIVGLTIEEFFQRAHLSPSDADSGEAQRRPPLWRSIQHGETVENEEWILTRPDGTRAMLLINAGPIRDTGGEIIGGVSVWRDITERKRAEEQLRESEERYRTISGVISDYVFSFRVDPGPSLVYEWMTPGFRRITGYTPEEVEAPGGIGSITFPEDRELLDRFIGDILSRESGLDMEYRVVARSGEVRWLSIFAKSVWSSEEGRVVRLYGAARDITQRKRAEEELRESEERYRRMVETAEEGIWILDSSNCTAFVNGKLAGMLGYTVEEMEGREVFDFTDEEWKSVMQENLRKRREGHRGQYDFKFRHREGKDLWVMISATPLLDRSGAYTGSFAMITDITDRKRTEQELRDARDELEERVWRRTVDLERAIEELRTEISERRRTEDELRKQKELLQTVVDSIPVMLTVIGPRDDVRLLNREFARLIGWSTDQAGAEGFWESIFPNARYREEILTFMRSPDHGWREISMRARDGRRVESSWVHVWLSDGTRIGIGIDITERRRMESALRMREREFEALVENAPDVIARFDRDIRLVYINRAVETETGISPGDLFSKPWRKLGIPEKIATRWMAKLRSVVETGREETIEIGLESPEGWKWYFTRMAPVIDPKGVVDSVLSISHNITELKNAESELRKHREHLQELVEERTAELRQSNAHLKQEIAERKRVEEQIKGLNENLRQQTAQLLASNKELEAFSYSVSHDLRAPLRSIDGFSLALMEDYSDRIDAEGRDYIQRIRASTQRMGQLIDDLLNLARVARMEMQHVPVNLSALAMEVTGDLKRMHPERRIETVIPDNIVAEGDPALLKQVLVNLLGNAWKFTLLTAEPRIEFGETTVEGKRAFYVRDNGAGFDMRYAGKLFQPFHRLHSKDEFAGTGIGLAIVRRIVQRHGGRVWAEGEPERGAVFFFTLE